MSIYFITQNHTSNNCGKVLKLYSDGNNTNLKIMALHIFKQVRIERCLITIRVIFTKLDMRKIHLTICEIFIKMLKQI